MFVQIASAGYACSTLMIGNLNTEVGEWVNSPAKNQKEFNRMLREAIHYSENNQDDDDWDDESILGDYYADQFAFFFASTKDDQEGVHEYLEKLGFTKTEPIFNDKNKTRVILYIAPVQPVLEKIGYKRKYPGKP